MNSTRTGKITEDRICKYLEENGFTTVERNYRSLSGEIDIIATRDKTLHIIEVKHIPYRWNIDEVRYKVDKIKQLKIKKTCIDYLYNSNNKEYDIIKFDVACVCGKNIYFWEGAFE